MSEEDRLEKGKKILDGIRERLFGSHVYAYLIGNKTYSHMYFSPKDHVDLDIDSYEPLIKSSWNAKGGATYLWEFIWNQVQNLTTKSTDLVIITDGFDNMSTGKFNGVLGFDELMLNIKQNLKIIPPVTIFCVSAECSGVKGKHYSELAIITEGCFCSIDN
jgi:hypothetical protein